MGDIYLDQQGQIVQLSATLKHVCPGKRVALAVVLTELAQDGTEYPRGMQTMTVPAHTGTACQDVPVSCIPFVVPGDASQMCIRDRPLSRSSCFACSGE